MTKDYDNWIREFAETFDKVEVVPPNSAAAKGASLVVCRLVTTPLLMPDNLTGSCCKCFRMVQFQPHVPDGPKKMCAECAAKEILKQRRKGKPVGYQITENTARDVAAFLRKKGMN